MMRTQTSLALLAILSCLFFNADLAQGRQDSRLISDIERGDSPFLAYDYETLEAAVSGGELWPSLDIRRSESGGLTLIRSSLPLRLRNVLPHQGERTAADHILGALKEEMGVIDGVATLSLRQTRSLHGRRTEYIYEQEVGGFRVLNSRIALVSDSSDRLHRFSGRYLSDELLDRVIIRDSPTADALTTAFVADDGQKLLGVGVFHGSLFGLETWSASAPVLAYVVVGWSEDGLTQTFLDADSGDVLYHRPLVNRADIDLYEDVDMPNQAPFHYAVDVPISVYSTQTCYVPQEIYPNCSTFPGGAYEVFIDTNRFDSYIDDEFGRASWDGATAQDGIDDCGDAGADLTKCCDRDDPSIYLTVSDWTTTDWNDYDYVWQGFEDLGFPYPPGAFFAPVYCFAIFSDPYQCTDAVGHEWAHAIDYSEKQVGQCKADEAQGLHCRHSLTISEAFADVVGESFQRTEFPSEGTPWRICDGEAYCQELRNLQTPAGADHASTIEWDADCHDNSTAISKGFHLLGRSPQEGAATHYGRSVTGIGLADATQIFYHAVVEELEGGSEYSFSDLREALLDAAASLYGSTSNQYTQTLATVDALGLWTSPASVSQSYDSTPELGYWGRPTSAFYRHPTVVFEDNGVLKYKYRYLSGWYLYWTSALTVGSTTGEFDVYTEEVSSLGLVVGHNLHIFYQDSSNFVKHFSRSYSGSTSVGSVTYNGIPLFARSGYPIRVTESASGYSIYYVPIFGSYVVKASLALSTNSITSVSTTAIPAAAQYGVAFDGTLEHAFYLDGSGLVHLVESSGGNWSGCGPSALSSWSDVTDFDADSFLGRIHLIAEHDGPEWLYSSSSGTCDGVDHSVDWTPENPVGAKPDESSVFAVFAPYFIGSGLTLATQESQENLSYRTKFSQ